VPLWTSTKQRGTFRSWWNGAEVVIAKAGKPIAKLVPFSKPARVRKPGLLKGKIRIADDFDAALAFLR